MTSTTTDREALIAQRDELLHEIERRFGPHPRFATDADRQACDAMLDELEPLVAQLDAAPIPSYRSTPSTTPDISGDRRMTSIAGPQTIEEIRLAALDRARSLGFPAIAFAGSSADGEASYAFALRSANAYQVAALNAQLAPHQERAEREAAQEERWAEEARRRDSAEAVPMDPIFARQAEEARLAVERRASVGGQLERLIELQERTVELLEGFQKRG